MKHYAGLDVSLKETSICILDEAGKIASHPEDLLRTLQDPAWHLERIGLRRGCSHSGSSMGRRRRACPSCASRRVILKGTSNNCTI